LIGKSTNRSVSVLDPGYFTSTQPILGRRPIPSTQPRIVCRKLAPPASLDLASPQVTRLIVTRAPAASALRPCLQYYIKRCLGPCVQELTTPEIYQEAVRDVKLFLEGKPGDLARPLHDRMAKAAESQRRQEWRFLQICRCPGS
jgi:hypothetical protein